MPSPFPKLTGPDFLAGEHGVLRFWEKNRTFDRLREQTAGGERWTFLDGPITANNPMGVHHAWGRAYKDAFRRYHAMNGRRCHWQNGFDCQGLWVEVEVQKEFGLNSKDDIVAFGVDRFVTECKRRVLRFAARQTEQSVRLGYWMDWDRPDELRKLADALGAKDEVEYVAASGETVSGDPAAITAKLGSPREAGSWGGSYFTFSTENNETIWAFLKKCHARGKVYRGNDVMPWGGTAGSAYSQMEVADGRKLTTHRSVFVRFPIRGRENEFLLAWTTTPWTLAANVACAVSSDLDYARVRMNRDGAVYHLAAGALNNQRLGKEFKEGFGSEGGWPEGVPKLKTLAQIFKEQGGFEVVGTVPGSELVGLTYDGPFDALPANAEPRDGQAAPATAHRVVDPGRDARGSALVTASEGTGVVHMAPSCGDVDHKVGVAEGLPIVPVLNEAGEYLPGYGELTGRAAYGSDTSDLVLERLKERGFHVADERYPHVYPHCWRTGEELIFRLVDEWLIRMDWRDEIKAVVKTIDWRPESIGGERRELEWLDNMRDWMVSKKRFWGLALPIWADPETGEFEVIGSLDELEGRAVEGWDGFAGRTPHKPWIDGVKIRSSSTGKLLSRVPDVGNPWLDAGITPFSTLGYNVDRAAWEGLYPVDLVSESFPGQFRNWFYSLLALGTMLRHGETDDPAEKRPFQTLFGYKLVLNEAGTAMHKSDGTAIWFEEAAEQLGVDCMRWLYLAQDPAKDLRFGTRHADRPVALHTPDGEITETREGFTTCEVTSGPADEVRRRVLIPVWNCLSFFTEYARADGFDPAAEQVPVADRPEIDRWLLARVQDVTAAVRAGFDDYRPADACAAVEGFVDDLSNWYIRRNRRRFWRGGGEDDRDKLAAYQTLHAALTGLAELLAPFTPFLAERMYQALVRSWDRDAAESVHLRPFPAPDAGLRDADLAARTAVAQAVVRLGHRLREETGHRVRQPLPELKVAADDPAARAAVESLADVIADELNVKAVTPADSLDDLVRYSFKPNLKTLGPRYGKRLRAIREELPTLADALAPLRRGGSVTVTVGGEPLDLTPDDVLVTTEQSGDWASASDGGLTVAMSTALTPELETEGRARDFVRLVQEARKAAGLDLTDRIRVTYDATDADRAAAVAAWADYVKGETLADALEPGETGGDAVRVERV